MKRLCFVVLMSVVCISLIAVSVKADIISSNEVVLRDPTGPYNLVALLLGQNDVLLYWENPVFINLPMGFRIYCNNSMVKYVPGSNATDCMLKDVCEGCHQFYVAAYFDTGCESTPSNVAELMITSANDIYNAVSALSLRVYPNPSNQGTQISLAGMKNSENAQVSVYNLKGQLIREIKINGNTAGFWDGKDSKGCIVSEGIYYIRALTSQGSITQKVSIIK